MSIVDVRQIAGAEVDAEWHAAWSDLEGS